MQTIFTKVPHRDLIVVQEVKSSQLLRVPDLFDFQPECSCFFFAFMKGSGSFIFAQIPDITTPKKCGKMVESRQ